jgi:plastocyanin
MRNLSFNRIGRVGPIGFAAVVGTAAYASGGDLVSQRGKVFGPAKIATKVGEPLRIVNDDDVVHHIFVNSDALVFDSGRQPQGEMVEIRFRRSGTYEVRCAIHPKMKLVVSVD